MIQGGCSNQTDFESVVGPVICDASETLTVGLGGLEDVGRRGGGVCLADLPNRTMDLSKFSTSDIQLETFP